MSWRRTQPRDIELEPRLSPADATLERLRPRLMVATQEELVAESSQQRLPIACCHI
jgi:hypothetical protein